MLAQELLSLRTCPERWTGTARN